MNTEKKFRRHVVFKVDAYKRLVDLHCCNGDSAEEISEEFGISRNVLQQGFKKMNGMGIREYKLKLRMEKARLLLEQGKDIKEISLTLNYKQPRALSTAFKRYYGVSPMSYTQFIIRDK